MASGFKGIQDNAEKIVTKISKVVDTLKSKPKIDAQDTVLLRNSFNQVLAETELGQSLPSEICDEFADSLTEAMSEEYARLRGENYDHADALGEIAKSLTAFSQWATEIDNSGISLTFVGNKTYLDLPGIQNADGGMVSGPTLMLLSSVLFVEAIVALENSNPETAQEMAEGLQNAVESMGDSVGSMGQTGNELLINLSDSYARLTEQTLVEIDTGDGSFNKVAMDVLEYDQNGHPTLVKEKKSNRVYEVTYDSSVGTLSLTYGQKELVYQDGVVVENVHHAENNSENDEVSGETAQNPPDHGSDDDWGITPEQEDIADKIARGHSWDKHVDADDGDLYGEFESQEEFADEI